MAIFDKLIKKHHKHMFGLYKKWKPKFFTNRITIPEFGGANGLSVCVVRCQDVFSVTFPIIKGKLIDEVMQGSERIYSRMEEARKRKLNKKANSRMHGLRKKRKAKKAHR